VMSFVGAFASNNSTFNIWIMLFFTVIAVLMDLGGLSISPMILGFILGPMLEINLRRGLTYSSGSFTPFLTRPVSAALLAVAVISALYSLFGHRLQRRRKLKDEGRDGV